MVGVFEMCYFSLALIQQLVLQSDVLPQLAHLLLVLVLLLLQLPPQTLILRPESALLAINGCADDGLPGDLQKVLLAVGCVLAGRRGFGGEGGGFDVLGGGEVRGWRVVAADRGVVGAGLG
jgi:hypothetical protein